MTRLRLAWLMLLCGATLSLQGASGAVTQEILGRLPTGAVVSFVKENGQWGIDIGGGDAPHILQRQPAHLEIYESGSASAKPQDMAVGYTSVRQVGGAATATADIARGAVTFHLEDRWSIKSGALWVHRHVQVTGNAEGGFGSAITFSTTPEVGWADVQFLAPSKLYGDPSFDGPTAPGSPLHNAARRFSMREMALTAPLFALNFGHGHSVTVLDPSPKGETTVEEAAAPTDTVMTDARYNSARLAPMKSRTALFSAIGCRERWPIF
jgi:hypothetical protein